MEIETAAFRSGGFFGWFTLLSRTLVFSPGSSLTIREELVVNIAIWLLGANVHRSTGSWWQGSASSGLALRTFRPAPEDPASNPDDDSTLPLNLVAIPADEEDLRFSAGRFLGLPWMASGQPRAKDEALRTLVVLRQDIMRFFASSLDICSPPMTGDGLVVPPGRATSTIQQSYLGQ